MVVDVVSAALTSAAETVRLMQRFPLELSFVPKISKKLKFSTFKGVFSS